ncbi:MAG: glucan biosynthesis protein G [Pseudomonadota bacterium]
MIDRRVFLIGTTLLAAAQATPAPAQAPAGGDEGAPFDAQTVRNLARELAARPFKAADRTLPPELQKLSYDAYRNIRFNPDRSLWRGQGLPFEAQLLHRGFLFADRVDIHVVAGGKARRLAYDPNLFRFEHGVTPPPPGLDLGFSGFRLHGPLNRADYFDEIVVFQGASYFRAVGKGQGYGSSARGLAIKTGAATGEEFPIFKAFWIEQPAAEGKSIVVHALLDSPSATAAHRFTIQPGETTITTVEMSLYPRTDLSEAGIGGLTSMFLFGPNDQMGFDDFRPAVRDAQGLAVIDGSGEHLWRPLTNPRRLEVSSFRSTNMRGFGLMQRQRSFFDYQDLEARYEKRPSLWLEPIGDWGEGAVHLVEIPTPEEVHDNIVAFWRPKDTLRKGGEYNYTYRLHWAWDVAEPRDLARVAATRAGAAGDRRLFVVDYVGGSVRDLAPDGVEARVTTNAGDISNIVLQPNPEMQGTRLSFALNPKGTDVAELRAGVFREGKPLTETWIYRWTP